MSKLIDIVARAPKSIVAPVEIAVEGEKIEINFTFKYRTQNELREWLDSSSQRGLKEEEMVLEAATGWDLEDEFNVENIGTLLKTFYAFKDVLDAYGAGLRRDRAKN